MSSGAYTMEKWTHGSEIVFKKNPNYWDADNVKVENIVYKIIPDNNSALNAFNNKEVDVTSITSEQAKGFKNNPKITIVNKPYIIGPTVGTHAGPIYAVCIVPKLL